MYLARVYKGQTSNPLRCAQTVAFKGNSPAKASLFNKLKHLADSSFTSGRTNSIQKAGQPGSKTQSRSASNAASKANSQVGSRAGSIGSRRDEYDVDEDDDDLEGFIYEDESTSEDEREDYVNAFGRKKKHRNHNDDFSDYEGAGVRALTAGGRVRAALVLLLTSYSASQDRQAPSSVCFPYLTSEEHGASGLQMCTFRTAQVPGVNTTAVPVCKLRPAMLPPQTANIKRAARARKRSEDDNGESSADESDTEEQTIRRLRREAREKREMAEALAAGTVLQYRQMAVWTCPCPRCFVPNRLSVMAASRLQPLHRPPLLCRRARRQRH